MFCFFLSLVFVRLHRPDDVAADPALTGYGQASEPSIQPPDFGSGTVCGVSKGGA